MRFFGYLWRFIERLVKAIQVIFFLFIVVFLVAVFSGMSGVAVKVPEKAALLIAPAGLLVEEAAGQALDQALLGMGDAQQETVVAEVVESLRRAAEDERIGAVVLLPQYLTGGGLSKLQTIADALDEFRATGKPVLSMADSYDQNQYFLAAHADEVYMHSLGFVLIEGFGYYKTYFADAIDKLNVDVNVFRVGEYKSFVEPFERNDMSLEDKENARRWLEQLWLTYSRDVAAARGMSTEAFAAYVDAPGAVLEAANGDAGAAAVSAGLVDGLKSYPEFRSYVQGLVGVDEEQADTFAHIDFGTYLRATEFENREAQAGGDQVAVIVASGEIIDGEADPGTIGSLSLSRLIRRAALDDNVKAVVLQIDSPGGSMFASQVVVEQLQALQETGKPYVASMSSVAASGGYYIAMPAEQIWAAATTISGSIGVGAIYPTFQRSLESLGVSVDGFGTGALSGQLNPAMELGDEARQLLDISVRSAYDVFIDSVAGFRGMDRSRVDEVARGQIWIGADAYELGLVDALGTLDDAVEAAAELAGLARDTWDVTYIREELSVAEKLLLEYLRLLGGLTGKAQAVIPAGWLQTLLDAVGTNAVPLQRWNDPRGLYYHCLCEVR